jgi:hypothetical protein
VGAKAQKQGRRFYHSLNAQQLTPSPSPTSPSPSVSPTPGSSLPASEGSLNGQSNNPNPLGSNNDTAYKQAVIRQIESTASRVGFDGYKLLDGYGDRLQDNSSTVISLSLEQGIPYSILAVCDQDCGDIDLNLYDENSNLISADSRT